jgi:Ni/Co efflux regulator RcnB
MKRLVTLAVAASLGLGAIGAAGAASAQPRYDGYRSAQPTYTYNHYNSGRSDWRDGRQGHGDSYGYGNGNSYGYGYGNGYGYDQRVDWREHGLRAPPRGYEWREENGRFVLAALAGGLIADLLFNAR